MTPIDFAVSLIAYAGWSRGSVTSWGRSPERNALPSIRGHANSLHLSFLAADIGYHPNPTPPLSKARKRASQLGMRLLRESDHDHLQAL